MINKTDNVSKPALLPIMQRYAGEYEFLEIIPISAQTLDNLDLLLAKVFEYLPEGTPSYDSELVTDRPERFLVG